MALTLEQLYDRQSDSVFRNKVKAACWKAAKALIQSQGVTKEQLTLANTLLTGTEFDKYVIATAVIIDDGASADSDILAAVTTASNKMLALIPVFP